LFYSYNNQDIAEYQSDKNDDDKNLMMTILNMTTMVSDGDRDDDGEADDMKVTITATIMMTMTTTILAMAQKESQLCCE